MSCEAIVCPFVCLFIMYSLITLINYPIRFSKTGHDTMPPHPMWSTLYVPSQASSLNNSTNSSSSISLPLFCESLQMGKLLGFLLIFSSLFIALAAAADWNILSQKRRNGVGSSSSLKNYCESWRINVEVNNIRGFDVVPQECVEYIKKYMTSSQYKADSERAIEEVKLYLSSCCTVKGDGKDAWIFDVDDTLLSTVPYYKKHGFG